MNKKILLVVPLPPPYHGSNVMNLNVANCAILYSHFNVKVLSLHYATSIADIGSLNAKKMIALSSYLFRLLKLMISFRPHAVYFVPAITGLPFYRDCLFALMFKCFGVHVIYHLHGTGIKNKLDSPLLFKLYRWFFKDATVIHLSPLLYFDIKDVVPRNQCKFLPNGIDATSLDPYQIAEKNHNPKPVILFLSNLIITKGPIELLKACRLLVDKGLEFKIYFVGNPSTELTEEVFVETIERFGLDDYVKYFGPRYGREKYEILAKSDALVFPTEKDAFPLILLEAMSVGLPVVSTNEGAIPEIIDEELTGFVVDKRNPVKLAEKIEYLISNPEQARKMGLSGRRKFERCYTIQKFNHNLLEIFDEVMGSR